MANNISELANKSNSVSNHSNKDEVFKEVIESQIALTKAAARHELAISKVAKILEQRENLKGF